MRPEASHVDPASPLSKRLAWLAPWIGFAKWKPWQRWTLFVVVLTAGYVLAPVPGIVALNSLWPRWGVAQAVSETVYALIWWACERSDALRAFYDFQLHTILGVPAA